VDQVAEAKLVIREIRERNLISIEEALAELERRTLVLAMDEAQNYSHDALEEIRLLLGLNLPERPAFALLLVGDDYLLGTLRLRHHRALYSRISAHYPPATGPRGSRPSLAFGLSFVRATLHAHLGTSGPPKTGVAAIIFRRLVGQLYFFTGLPTLNLKTSPFPCISPCIFLISSVTVVMRLSTTSRR
jgi:hypothetical protein